MEPLRALVVAVYVLTCSLAVGGALSHVVRATLGVAERVVVGWTLGLGAVAYALTLVGLAGAYWPAVVSLTPGLLALASIAALAASR